MPRLISLMTLALVALLAALYVSGADRALTQWALSGQREAQDAMAGGLRALRAGEGAALAGFLLVCFSYGFFHAAGPGHGKLLIGGYGAARAVGVVRLSSVALVASLAQGLSAILLVGAGVWIWQLGRARMTDLADRLLAPLSFGAIALIGLWLVWRGLRSLRLAARHDLHDHKHGHDHGHGHGHGHGHDHDHAHDHPADCAHCGHAHLPDPAQIAAATGWRDMAVLIGAIAIRPCTGALFILILTAQMGIFAIGVAGTLAMALGTAAVTIAVAFGAVMLRRGVIAGLLGNPALAKIQPMIEIAVGLLIAVIAARIALAAI
ncbi:nickel/cobalt transporter [Roseicyclus sp.]|uniref:nickel/cobalt transporter n=1 Tax=Roseicyclus sp. TaxID=1914329 RepID=UPI003F6B8AEB